jgi:hypothetical protein
MILFADRRGDVTPQPASFFGQFGTWFSVPQGWFVRTNEDGTTTASPNSDFSQPTYDVSLNENWTMVFQSLGGAFNPDNR